MIPNAPGDRSHNTSEASEQIYLIYDNQQHGPYSLVIVSILRDKGDLPKDTLYWQEGMAGARQLAELADEITASLPRPHHYRFAYRWMPYLVFLSPISHSVCRSTKAQLLRSWQMAGEEMAEGEIDPPNGLDVELLRFDSDADLLFVTMPTPRRVTEAYSIGIVFSRSLDITVPVFARKIRYFVLSHSDADEEFGRAEGCIREIMAEGRNFRAKDFVEPFKDNFIAAIRELCKHEPRGAFCVVPPTQQSGA